VSQLSDICCLFCCLFPWASRQTHTQGNNKNNEGKQHRNKTQMENMQSVTTWEKKRQWTKKSS
jgi:hypothetical protein